MIDPRLMHALRIKLSFVSMCSGRFLKHSFVVLSGPPFFVVLLVLDRV